MSTQAIADGYERAVLGCVLKHREGMAIAAEVLGKEHFYKHAHQVIWEACEAVWQEGSGISLVSVADKVFQAGLMGDVRWEYFADLDGAACVPSFVAKNAAKVREYWLLRSLGKVGALATKLSEAPDGPPVVMLENIEKELFGLTREKTAQQSNPIGKAIGLVYDRIDRRRAGQIGLMTGLTDLDLILCGLHEQELTIVAARPSVGKSAFAVNLIHTIAAEGKACLLCSLEMPQVDVAERMICLRTGIDGYRMRQAALSPGEEKQIIKAGDDIGKMPIVIDDSPKQSMVRITAAARRMMASEEGLALVIVDYLQLIEPATRKEPRYAQVGQISRDLKLMAREVKVPVVALAQLKRGGEDRKDQHPRMSDLRESGDIEQNADCIVLLSPDGKMLDVIVDKNRHGPTGSIAIRYDKATHKMSDADAAF